METNNNLHPLFQSILNTHSGEVKTGMEAFNSKMLVAIDMFDKTENNHLLDKASYCGGAIAGMERSDSIWQIENEMLNAKVKLLTEALNEKNGVVEDNEGSDNNIVDLAPTLHRQISGQ